MHLGATQHPKRPDAPGAAGPPICCAPCQCVLPSVKPPRPTASHTATLLQQHLQPSNSPPSPADTPTQHQPAGGAWPVRKDFCLQKTKSNKNGGRGRRGGRRVTVFFSQFDLIKTSFKEIDFSSQISCKFHGTADGRVRKCPSESLITGSSP